MKLIIACLVALAFAPGAWGQSTVRTQPFGARTSVLSGSIAVTDVFQSIQAANTNRLGCFIQNKGTHDMWVYFGPVASATEDTSAKVPSGSTINCISGGLIVVDQVSITGTSADLFTANFQ